MKKNNAVLYVIVLLSGTTMAQGVQRAPINKVINKTNWDGLRLAWNNAEKDDIGNYFGCPIGNSMIGAKIKGGVECDVYQLNNKTFWSGGPRNTDNPERQKVLKEVRQKLAVQDIPAADALAKGMWDTNEVGTYLPLGKMLLEFPNSESFTNYKRTLDINKALCTIQYKVGDVNFKRESFASFPDKIILVRISADKPGKINFTVKLKYQPEMEGQNVFVESEGQDVLIMKSKAQILENNKQIWDDKKGMFAITGLKVINRGGQLIPGKNSITVKNADNVILILANETSYNGPFKEPGTNGIDPIPIVNKIIAKAAKKTYEQLLSAHVSDYQSLFQRLSLEINGDYTNKYAIGFQYARYDMISVSRVGDRPHNQQGMWNHSWRPMSNCSHFLNENVEKYYSLIETSNIAECGEPLWNWMDELAVTGARTAKIDWGFNGWLAPHYSDIWCSTTLKGGNNEWAIWPMGGVWLCENLWDHYAFSMDKEFLRKRAFPIMKGAAEFCLDLLVEDGKGHLVTSPSTSPENQFELSGNEGNHFAVSQGSTMDLALVRELFEHCIKAIEVLDEDKKFADTLKSTLVRILPYQINNKGELQEWSQDFNEHYQNHRHASHLVAVWPFSQITEQKTPELFAAAKMSLKNRNTGGYHPDKAAMWARLKEGDKSLNSRDSFYNGGGLVGQFPPKYSALPEMLVQSHDGVIDLLPALPTTWKSGKVTGLRARGDYEVSIEWNNSILVKCQIDSHTGSIPVIQYNGSVINPEKDKRVKIIKR